MKKYTFFFIAAVALISCSKAETDDLLKTTTEHGDKVVLTSPSIPTRVAISDHQYVFEKSDKIVLVSSRSKRYAVLEQVTEDDATSFQGEFNGNIAEDDTFTAYYNCADTDDATQLEKLVSGTTTLIQNGMPWMSSEGLEYTRDAMGRVTISSPEFSALQGYRAVAVEAPFTGTFSLFPAGSTDAVASGIKLIDHSGNDVAYSAIVNVKDGMEGFWIKVKKDGKSMYKSYSKTVVTENKKVTIKEFVPVYIDIDIQISGFATSYSYYKGIDGVEKNIATANATANDWIGSGSASYTIESEGIPSTLFTFESFKLTVDGKEYTGNETTKLISVDETTGHTKWEEKTIVASVTYKDIEGIEYTSERRVTRHITGLPYVINDFSLVGTGTVQKNYTFQTPASVYIKVILSNTILKTTYRGFDFETYASENKIGTLSIAKKAFGNEADYISTTFIGALNAGGSIRFKIDNFDRSLTCTVSKIKVCYNDN